ncbi:MAG: sugar phosphate nucleotidyltransferase [Solirubrobacterales bacterium]
MADPPDTPVAILCGGRGTRLSGDGAALAKPLVEIGGHPIVWHVVMLYQSAGFRDFTLLTGFLGDQVASFADETDWPDGVTVTAIDTGEDTPTGGRVLAARERLGDGTFCLTYADGLTDADLASVLSDHRASGAQATVTAVRPELPFGVVRLAADGEVSGFAEKPRMADWVNGGFICGEAGLLDVLEPDGPLEGVPLETLAASGKLHAYRHDGFWACMDTYKEAAMLNGLWERGEAPWCRW